MRVDAFVSTVYRAMFTQQRYINSVFGGIRFHVPRNVAGVKKPARVHAILVAAKRAANFSGRGCTDRWKPAVHLGRRRGGAPVRKCSL